MNETKPIQSGTTILCLILGTEGYGVRRAWTGLITGFLSRGIQPLVAALQAGELSDRLHATGAEVAISTRKLAPNPSGRGGTKVLQMVRRGLSQIRQIKWLEDVARQSRARAILVRSPSEALLAGLVARRLGIRAFWLLPNSVSDYPLNINRRIYKFAFRHFNVIPISNSVYTDTTIGPGEFERHVVHLGIDPKDFPLAPPPLELRADLGIASDAVVIGVFARMVREKGQLRLLESVAALGDEARDVHLLFLGGPLDTEYAAEIRNFAAEHGLAQRVSLPGPTSDVQRFYRMCDIVANSRLDPEPFGFSVIEAMMLGRPILAHKAGGPGETILDGHTGWLISGPDVLSFTDGLRRALGERNRWHQIGINAREHALTRFNHQRMADDILTIMFE